MKLSPVRRHSARRADRRKEPRLIAVGQQALASADAYPKGDVRGRGRLHQSGHRPAACLGRGEAARALSRPTYLRQDMTVSVDIETAKRPSALIVPAASAPRHEQRQALGLEGRRSGAQRANPSRLGSSAPARPRSSRASGRRTRRSGDRDGEREGARIRARVSTGSRAMNRWAPFEWITALRFLKEGRMQTMFIVAAVAIGVAVIVFMSAMLCEPAGEFPQARADIAAAHPAHSARRGGAAVAPPAPGRSRGLDRPASGAAHPLDRPVAEDQGSAERMAGDRDRVADHGGLRACGRGRCQPVDQPDRDRPGGLFPDRAHSRLHCRRPAARH